MTKAEKAAANHRHFYSCSASVLCAFAEDAGLDEKEAKSLAAPMAGGRQGKCGAVLAAEYVLAKKYPDDAQAKTEELEKAFTQMNKYAIQQHVEDINTNGLTGTRYVMEIPTEYKYD